LTQGQWTLGTIDDEPVDTANQVDDGEGGLVDKDWYKVSLSKDLSYNFEGIDQDLSTGWVALAIYDSSGVLIDNIYGASGTDKFIEGPSPTFNFDTSAQIATTQDYYLAVSAGSETASGFLTATGDYQVRFSDLGPTQPIDNPFDFSGNSQASWYDILLAGHLAVDSYNGTGSEALFRTSFEPNLTGLTNSGGSWSPILTTDGGGPVLKDGTGNIVPQHPSNIAATMQATAYRETKPDGTFGRVLVAFRGTDDEVGVNLGNFIPDFPDELLSTSFPLGLGVPEIGEDPTFLSALNRLGVSESELVTTSYVEEAFHFVEALVDSGVPIEEVSFTGHSLGAMVASYVASSTDRPSMVFAGGFNESLTSSLPPNFFEIEGEFLGEISKLGNTQDGFLQFATWVGTIINLLPLSDGEVDALLDKWVVANSTYNELPNLNAGNQFDLSTLFFDSFALHKMQLHYLITYADKILFSNISQQNLDYKNIDGFLSGFSDFDLADSADEAIDPNQNSYIDDIPIRLGDKSFGASQMFSDIVLSALDDRPDVLTGLLVDVEQDISKISAGPYATSNLDAHDLISAISHIAIENAARSVLNGQSYDHWMRLHFKIYMALQEHHYISTRLKGFR